MSDPNREVRYCAVAPIELREAEGDLINVTGYAATFGEPTEIGPLDRWGWVEVIEQGAFTDALARGDDVPFLINHRGLPLARNTSGTLTLSQDQRGLRIDTALDPTDPDVQRILPKMKRGDLSKMSFAFASEKETWDETGEHPKRSIQSVQLFDVSIVTDPAYEGTEIGLRSKTAALGGGNDFFLRTMQMRGRLSGLT
ncbi:HK97 family phage prohead protease [Phaeobacter gallaeciensis]|uniref:HK97 family phage prohead protease n=1 Tax=Phaeobacter gallaeciensis TaxID=60890 RepID=UPI00237F5593|nr:HK97 family phage prohead protease [Phaeobacter gallaeciensis]MDE4098956.1 HK97 family phage prohead protease [Phaeobacter gallaeciensis]MDE4107766.1 HK97 family phage prohead protease [Phaeobacter gallaeciensis]MDE4112220.1 HK97 family phage prohead protease [Phaeobacter gallaeciensis]MDE4116692.1 HK97 family phage prohead protease [Phaeobacter gallaeciensis]MDE4121162.1 HK97 family phage prohead protease [Phaeobacter gallaeciensis]